MNFRHQNDEAGLIKYRKLDPLGMGQKFVGRRQDREVDILSHRNMYHVSVI